MCLNVFDQVELEPCPMRANGAWVRFFARVSEDVVLETLVAIPTREDLATILALDGRCLQ